MGLFTFGSSKDSSKDFFSTTLFSTRLPALISEEDALKIPAVKAAVELISNSISTLPIYLYSENESDHSVEKVEDSRINVLNHSSNKFQTAQAIKKAVVQDYLLHGIAYLYKKNGELHHLKAKNVQTEDWTEDGITISRREFQYSGMSTVTLSSDEVIIIDSKSNGILVDGGKILQIASQQIEYSTALLSNSAVPTGVVSAKSRLTEKAINTLRSSWEKLYQGTGKAGRTIVLEEGLEFSALSLRPDEMQLTESNKQMVSDIARLFNLPESLINSQANKYNSLEANSVSYLQNTLSPIITSIENSFDKHLLDDIERSIGFYFRFDTSEIIRTTEEQKVKTTAEAFNKGLISFNQAAYKLDLPKIKKDYHLLSTGTVLRYEDGSFEYPNLGPQENQPEVTSSNE